MIREIIPSRVGIADGEYIFKDSDILYIIGENESIMKFQNSMP